MVDVKFGHISRTEISYENGWCLLMTTGFLSMGDAMSGDKYILIGTMGGFFIIG